MLLDSIQKHRVLTEKEIHSLESSIADVCTTSEYVADGKVYNKKYGWDFYSDATQDIRSILEPHLPHSTYVTQSHILESYYPFELHTDVNHTGDSSASQYTVIIPLDDYNSQTFVFNEYNSGTNEFEDFKAQYTGELKLRIPRELVLTLTHLHPKDLMYLSLKETFNWDKGSMFAFDRKYYHCSDNYIRAGETSKRAILLWTVEQ